MVTLDLIAADFSSSLGTARVNVGVTRGGSLVGVYIVVLTG